MLTGVAGGRASTCSEPVRKEVVFMYVTWSELIGFVAMLTGVIALIVQIHKNSKEKRAKCQKHIHTKMR